MKIRWNLKFQFNATTWNKFNIFQALWLQSYKSIAIGLASLVNWINLKQINNLLLFPNTRKEAIPSFYLDFSIDYLTKCLLQTFAFINTICWISSTCNSWYLRARTGTEIFNLSTKSGAFVPFQQIEYKKNAQAHPPHRQWLNANLRTSVLERRKTGVSVPPNQLT